jgi:hypothetical protein
MLENLSSQTSSAGHGSGIARPNGELGFELDPDDEETMERSFLCMIVSK